MTLFPKGPTRKAEKTQRKTTKRKWLTQVREAVMIRDRGCRVCGGTDSAEMHELVPRSLMRGRAIEDIFSMRNCVRLCSRCHRDVTEHRITLLPVSEERGADGRVEVQRRLP